MKRSEFIKLASLIGPGLYLGPGFLTSCNDDIEQFDTNKKVLIIGAGVAGLAAAKYLNDRNIETLVLEAQEKIGGRLKVSQVGGVAFGEGASWIHGPHKNPIKDLAYEAGCETYITKDGKVEVYKSDGNEYESYELNEAEEKFEEILATFKGEVNKSFEEVFYEKYPDYKGNELWDYFLSAYLEFDTGGDISSLSSTDFYDDEAYRGRDKIITNGYDRVADYLAKGVEIKLNQKVKAIKYTETDIVVTTANNDAFIADFAIVSIPLGVLKSADVIFEPVLPDGLQEAIESLEMGGVNKFLCIWDEAFWNEKCQYIGYTSKQKGAFNYFLNVGRFADVNALMTFTFGDFSVEAETLTDEEIIDQIMENLRAIYGNDIPRPHTFSRTKWSSNPYSYGAYSYVPNTGRSTAFESFEDVIDGKLHFAGEHTSRDYRGTVHGAYLSGVREAEKIIKKL